MSLLIALKTKVGSAVAKDIDRSAGRNLKEVVTSCSWAPFHVVDVWVRNICINRVLLIFLKHLGGEDLLVKGFRNDHLALC